MQPIVPDVFVRSGPDGSFLVELNSDTLPKVLVNQSYHAEVAKTAKSEKDKTYLADCLQTATWLMRALDQRAKTILKVSTEIVRQQDAFFAAWRPASATAQSQDRRRRDLHARIHGVARHRQQIHGDQSRYLRAEIFLHLGDRLGRWRRSRIRPKRCATASGI